MRDFKPILIFILKFVVVGVVLILLYNLYLSQYHKFNLPDPYSIFIADCTVLTLNTVGFDSSSVIDQTRPWVWIRIDDQWPSIINEGCNAISVMIIFIAFIVAFSTTWKQTSLFILSGLFIIQIMNVLRIALLNYIFVYLPDYGKIAHDYLFPAIIYGTIVVLWIIWVRFFALKIKTIDNKKWASYLIAFFLTFGLILVRMYENQLFYDPFLAYFKGDYFNAEFPKYDLGKVTVHIIFRYSLNALISLGIIWFLFKDKQKLKFSIYVLLAFLIVLLPLYLYMIGTEFSIGQNIGFYIRRFLIQPMLVLMLVPAFFYHQYLTKKDKKQIDNP